MSRTALFKTPCVKGGTHPTIDGYATDRAANLRELLRENRSVPTPVRRVDIPTAHGKQRPWGRPGPNDQQVQEGWSEILEALYETVLSESKLGVRPVKSCQKSLD